MKKEIAMLREENHHLKEQLNVNSKNSSLYLLQNALQTCFYFFATMLRMTWLTKPCLGSKIEYTQAEILRNLKRATMESNNKPQVIVQECKKGKLAQEIIIGEHHLLSDEPVLYGGNDSGPSPYDLLLAALGSCTSMTIRMYAELKKLPLEKVIVKLTHKKIHIEDCVGCEKASSKIDSIDRKIKLTGTLTQEQRSRLLEIANMCPVHRTLTTKILINTTLT